MIAPKSIPTPTESDVARFWSKVARASDGECWPWLGSQAAKGRSRMTLGRRYYLAPRISWLLANGQDPGELLVCHSCDNACCVNPKHLWLGTNRDNAQDAVSKGLHPNQVKTHCPQGHEYTPGNTYFYPKTHRRACRICIRAHGRNYEARKNQTPRPYGLQSTIAKEVNYVR